MLSHGGNRRKEDTAYGVWQYLGDRAVSLPSGSWNGSSRCSVTVQCIRTSGGAWRKDGVKLVKGKAEACACSGPEELFATPHGLRGVPRPKATSLLS